MGNSDHGTTYTYTASGVCNGNPTPIRSAPPFGNAGHAEIGISLPNNQRQHRAHPDGFAALRIVLVTVPRVSRFCEQGTQALRSSGSLGLTDYSGVDTLGLRNKSTNFGPKTSPGSPIKRVQRDWLPPATRPQRWTKSTISDFRFPGWQRRIRL